MYLYLCLTQFLLTYNPNNLCYSTNKNIFQAFNDLIGFAGPLLLNKLIKFLQQGLLKLSGT